MNRLTNAGLFLILGRVTLIMSVVLVASIAGLIVDSILRTTPMYLLIGFVTGNLIAFIGIWLFIRAGVRGRDDTGTS